MNNTPVISGWSQSGQSYPTLTSSNYNNLLSLASHPTCCGYFVQTHYGAPPSGKSVYNSINHYQYYKYDVISDSDYGFYMVPCSTQTGVAVICFAVFTDIPYSSSRKVKLQWRFRGYSTASQWSSYYNKLNYIDVPLTYIGTNTYNTLFVQPSGYQALTYLYTGYIQAVPDYYWIDLIGRSWMELCGLLY